MQQGKHLHLAALAGALALVGWSSRTALASPPTPTATGLPAGFSTAVLGSSTTDAESVSVDSKGVWTIQAGGAGLGDTDGGLGIYQKLSGNGSVIAHITSQSDPGAQVAVVFRADPTDAASPILRSKYSAANLIQPEIRRNSGDMVQEADQNNFAWDNSGSTAVGFRGFTDKGGATIPGTGALLSNMPWIGIDRNGGKFSFFSSSDGKVWTLLATAVDSMSVYPNDMLVGIEASKGSASAVSTITLDGVAVSPALLTPAAITYVRYEPRDKSVIVAWNPAAVTGADVTYNLYSFNTPNVSDTPKKVNTDPIKDSTFMVENLTNGQSYRFGVTAVVNGVEGPLALPLPSVLVDDLGTTQPAGGIGLAVPNPPTAGGLQLYTFGTNTPGTVTVTGTGAAASYDLKFGGADFWESGDGGSMLAMPLAGDLDMSLRLVQGATDNGNGWAAVGPTFRETLDPGSRMVMVQLSAAKTMQFKRRLVENQRPRNTDIGQSSGDNTTRPIWGRLVRKKDAATGMDTFTGYFAEGAKTPAASDWQPLGDVTSEAAGGGDLATFKDFAPMPYVGLSMFAATEGDVSEAVVDNLTIKPAQ
jgi:hypothetical protein